MAKVLPDWLMECEDLAPLLKEKLAADKEHSWRDAPYIHEDVREILEKAAPAPPSISYAYIPTIPSYNPYNSYYPYYQPYQWTPYGGGGGRGFGGMCCNSATYLDSLVRQQEMALEYQLRQLQMQIAENMANAQVQTIIQQKWE